MKPAASFYKDCYKKDGLTVRCKKCSSEAKAWKKCSTCQESKPDAATTFFRDDNVCRKCRIATGEKRCTRCHSVKSLDAFYRNGKNRWFSMCRRCHDEAHKKNHNYARIKREFGLSKEEYEKLLEAQGSVCAICHLPETIVRHGKTLPLHIDHCHRASNVRGLLCADCNIGIGRFHDSPELLRAAADYLERTNVATNF